MSVRFQLLELELFDEALRGGIHPPIWASILLGRGRAREVRSVHRRPQTPRPPRGAGISSSMSDASVRALPKVSLAEQERAAGGGRWPKHAAGTLGAVVAIVYIFLWASAFVPSRVLARGAPPLSILSMRFLFAGGLVLIGARVARLSIPKDARAWVQMLLLGMGGNALYLGLNYEALRHMSAGMGSIVASTNPLVIALIAPFVLGEPLRPRKIVGLVLGFGGVLIAMHARTGTQAARVQDVLLSFAGVCSFVASNVVYKRMHLRPHPVVLNGAQLFCAGVVLVPAALLLEGVPHIHWTAPITVSLAYLVVVLSIGASMLWFWILQHGEASRVSAYFFLTPVFGLLIGAALLGEPLTWLDAVGLAVIAAGLWLVARS